LARRKFRVSLELWLLCSKILIPFFLPKHGQINDSLPHDFKEENKCGFPQDSAGYKGGEEGDESDAAACR